MSAPPPLSVELLLGPQGALSAALPAYEHRPEQLQMARAVERALAEHHYLLVEAGTGTGKTLAYLLPALLSGRKAVVSTATKTLQDQIFFKDLVLLKEQVGLSFEAVYLKGRSNYLCLHRFAAFEAEPQFDSREEAQAWPQLQAWATRTETGDKSELVLPETFATWSRLSMPAESCLGSRCPVYESCFVTRMRRRAEEAQLLVVNHALFFADLALGKKRGEGGVLPPYDAVIFDEAHALEEVASSYFGSQVGSFQVEQLVRDAQAALGETDLRHGLLQALAIRLRTHAEALFQQAPRALGMQEGEGSVALEEGRLKQLASPLEQVSQSLAALAAFATAEKEPELSNLARRSAELVASLDFLRKADSPDHVYWGERRGRSLSFRASPIDVACELQASLYGSVDTVVFTSATLATQGHFDFVARRLGVEGAHALALPSPFDFEQQASLYLPTHLPEPNAPAFLSAVVEEVVALCEITSGRAFVLFTSLRNMREAHARAQARLPYQVLLQGERPKQQLLQAFRAEPSVLFASHSFWEGVDVPGEALSLVIMDRLPFASPGDPRVAARIRQLELREEDPFQLYQLPQAALALRQGFGRLIRTQADRGVVAILDRRIVTRSYGRALLASLPPATRSKDLQGLQRWFSKKAGS